MRRELAVRDFTYQHSRYENTARQKPDRIIVHRGGVPGHRALNSLEWGDRTGSFSIHEYIDADGTVFHAVEWDRHAFHVIEPDWARRLGMRIEGEYGARGDYDSVGIETTEVLGGAHRQKYSLPRETRISLVIRCEHICRIRDISPDRIYEHADFDPLTRPDDVGDALNIEDLRDDVRDLLAGREPWRTVGEFATGARAPASWKPGPPPPPAADIRDRVDVGAIRLPLHEIARQTRDGAPKDAIYQQVGIGLAHAGAAPGADIFDGR